MEVYLPDADVIRVVLDNLNTHTPAAPYETSSPADARRIVRKLAFHHSPKHGSRLDMADIELSILAEQCLDRRLPYIASVRSEVAAWEARRNADRATISWCFGTQDARLKLKRPYPSYVNAGLEFPTFAGLEIPSTNVLWL